MKSNSFILFVIVIAQFLCTSLWFAGNGVMSNLIHDFNLDGSALGHLTTAVQFGFIIGTLTFAILSIADRFSPSKVFFSSAILAALFNLGIIWDGNHLTSILIFRFMTGFFLAGIYPVGMKIAADYFEKGLGKALGLLVGALVVGTALPHLLKEITIALNWKSVILGTTTLASIGGLAMYLLVDDGPFRKASQQLDFSNFMKVFKNRDFRISAFGYFGHMWELYAFWVFVPVILESYKMQHDAELHTSLMSFFIIGVGGLACAFAGQLASFIGTKRTALFALLLSATCCLVSPFFFTQDSALLCIIFLLFWSMVVIADSPLFSTLVAQNAPPEIKGTALTIVNCIGFSITIVSIQLMTAMRDAADSNAIYAVLAVGPILGLIGLIRSRKEVKG